ncbi:bifunctional helix-turn-helix transcriptional regulator/GNAT family N-acetyltransferase [Halocatena halophila]|uniref:bifunctional helix-turn-helix transcriptional regulator/GNAT family N-acetyltransferase n=1 Tax=Halocatena halophila TaxID=2814576 RepID=UPI002ED5D9B3
MTHGQVPSFDRSIHEELYDYIERHGSVAPPDLAEAVGVDPETMTHEIAILKRDGYVEEHGGEFQVVLEAGTAEEYVSSDLTFVVRPARQSDLTGIVGTIRAITAEKTYLVAESVAEQINFEGVLLRNNDVERRMFFVATVNDDVVGWAHIEAPQLEKLSHAAKLTVGVLPTYRRHGMGSHLLHRGLEWARSHDYKRVYNSIPATNQNAARFLEDHGFETEAIRKDHYQIEGSYTAELMMARTLDTD